MSSKKKKTIDLIDHFGDDFEVSYEDDFEEASYNKQDNYKYDDDYIDAYDDEYEDDEDDDYNYNQSYHSSRKKRTKKMTPIAAPIKKSTKAAYRLIQTLLRNLSLALILAIIVYMAVNFIKGSVPYGNIEEELHTQDFSYKLVGYFAVAACLIFYEILAALWTMSKARVRDQYGRHKEDVGRGLFSFIFIYLCSYAAFLLSSHIPEIHDAVLGAQGALTVFGSMHNVLFGICTAGVISCLLRKYHL